jgi:hypothetical protein
VQRERVLGRVLVWTVRAARTRWLSAQFEARYAHVNSPWGMLDREEARRMAMEYCRRLAIDLNSVQYIRPIYDPRAFL